MSYTALRDVQEDMPVAYDADRNEIYYGETTYIWEGREVVTETFQAAIRRLVEKSPQQLALDLGIEMVRYG